MIIITTTTFIWDYISNQSISINKKKICVTNSPVCKTLSLQFCRNEIITFGSISSGIINLYDTIDMFFRKFIIPKKIILAIF